MSGEHALPQGHERDSGQGCDEPGPAGPGHRAAAAAAAAATEPVTVTRPGLRVGVPATQAPTRSHRPGHSESESDTNTESHFAAEDPLH